MKSDTPPKNHPKVAVLLAAYNGMEWIDEQITSILLQEDVAVTVFLSVDVSSDNTLDWCQQRSLVDNRIVILPYGERFGGAAKNFYRLFRDVDFSEFDYVALSDQDDIWLPDKLKASYRKIIQENSDVYSCNVMAFWADGRQKLINKAHPQRKYDFLFQGGGAGCTYVLKTKAALLFKEFLLHNWQQVNEVDLHDWLIYAFFRSQDIQWYIDPNYKMLYRQHENNQFGANNGISAAYRRIKMLKKGWYSSECTKISALVHNNCKSLPPIFLESGFRNRLFLLKNICQLRRSSKERAFLFIAILAGLY